jgi:hypothetical protein
VSAVEEYELEKMNYSIPYNKRTTNELLRIAANGFIPNKTKLRGPDRGYIHHHHYYYYWFLDLKKIQVVVRYVPGKKIAKRIIIIRILFFERAQFSLGA